MLIFSVKEDKFIGTTIELCNDACNNTNCGDNTMIDPAYDYLGQLTFQLSADTSSQCNPELSWYGAICSKLGTENTTLISF